MLESPFGFEYDGGVLAIHVWGTFFLSTLEALDMDPYCFATRHGVHRDDSPTKLEVFWSPVHV